MTRAFPLQVITRYARKPWLQACGFSGRKRFGDLCNAVGSQNSQAAQSGLSRSSFNDFRTQLLFAREFLNDAPVSEKSQYINMHRHSLVVSRY